MPVAVRPGAARSPRAGQVAAPGLRAAGEGRAMATAGSGPWAPRIVTERLVLRLLEPADVPATVAYQTANAAHLAPTSPLRPAAFFTEPFWRAQVGRDHEDAAAERAIRLFLFPVDDPGRIVGTLSLNNIVRGAAHWCDLGYALADDQQGRGLMGEAVAAAVRYAFAELRLHRVRAAYLPTNERSGRLLRRLGFVVEGYARDYLLIAGRWQDQILVGLVNPEWRPPD